MIALKFEEPAGGGVGDARSLAKVYSILANGGQELNISPETLEILTNYTESPEDDNYDLVMGFETIGSSGGYAKPTKTFNFGSNRAFGFLGTGGSFAFADPEYNIGYAYVMNKMDFYGMNDPREIAIREAIYRCIKRLN